MAFPVPAQTHKASLAIENFRGIDLNNSPANVDKSRSPSAPHMVRDQVGKVRKRMGYKTAATAPAGARINGVYHLGAETLVHAGAKLYRWDGKAGDAAFTELGAMADERSQGFAFDKKLYLLDGTTYQVYDGKTLEAVSAKAFEPTIIISRKPAGGGVSYQALNLLGKGWKESFLGDGSATVYQLTTKELSTEKVKAEFLNKEGDWVEKKEGTDFSVDRKAGKVTFNSAPPAPDVKGKDNVRITAYKEREGYLDKINKCRSYAVYGVGGAADRIFCTGNPELPGQDFYSGFEDPTYFPDTGYSKLSRNGAAVVGYAILNNLLAAFLSDSRDGRSVVIRSGGLDEKGEPQFKIVNTLLGENPVCPYAFAFSGKEPLFLTEGGVYAITAEELTGEKYEQERSYYIKSALEAIPDKGRCFATIYRDFYVLSTGQDFFLLDLKQKDRDRNAPYSSFQYECYFWPGISARVLWTEGERLCFGTEEGKLCRFATEPENPKSYSDDGRPIVAWWDTPDFDGQGFYKTKTFTSVSCRLASAVRTRVKIYGLKGGSLRLCYDSKGRAQYLHLGHVNFAHFTFRLDKEPRTVSGKVKIKKVDKTRFRLTNDELDEPFGLYAFATEWLEPGNNYKR